MKPVRLRLPYRPPLDWDALIAFLAARATPGVEDVAAGRYRRTIAIDGRTGAIEVWPCGTRPSLNLVIRFPGTGARRTIAERVRRMFGLAADPAAIARHLGSDPLLGPLIKRHPGLRAPGAWDGFELSVRAILGQQVSVAAATTIAGRLARRFGSPVEAGDGLDRIFPTPAQLAQAPIEEVGVIGSRAQSIRVLAQSVTTGAVTLDPAALPEAVAASLQSLPGIGPWTAQYIAMRALGHPDAFLAGDLILRRVAGHGTATALEARAACWRPWRAYAVMLLWQAATDEALAKKGRGKL